MTQTMTRRNFQRTGSAVFIFIGLLGRFKMAIAKNNNLAPPKKLTVNLIAGEVEQIY
ncbi:hypothetical protein [Aphanothece hegewaldii]|uniref:hypothetical protein n=1 Tax=Aphanothece hegewaldii TaxID=1521625 RepID=UPI0015E6C172|nr:hypothetical protein [Aphanothece hegewaldii]